jgi:patatin-like phospholipase/acyl hydrolase
MNSVNECSYINNVDGGVLANNPALIGLTEAVYCLDIPLENIEVLSLGTGTFNLKDQSSIKKRGLRYWLLPHKKSLRIYEVMASGQSIYIDNTMKLMSQGAGHDQKGRFRYHRIQKMLEQNIPMDASDDESLNRLANIGQELYKNDLEHLKHFIQHKIEPYKHNI